MLKRIFEKRGNKGFTFVEIICAVAILSLVSGIIGGVITISTRTYRKGISDTSVQQTAQLAANNISNIVKDACKVVYGESEKQYIENGTTWMTETNGSAKMQEKGYTELSLITNENIQYTVTYDMDAEALTYKEYQYDSTNDEWSSKTDSEIMAENITSFTADTSQFEANSTIELAMTVKDSDTGKEVEMTYTMKSRNGVGEGVAYNSSTDDVVIIFLESDPVLVPGETYQIPISVVGKLKEGLDWGDVSSSLTGVKLTTDYAEIMVNTDAMDEKATFTVRTIDKDSAGNYKDTASATVYIRRVKKVEVSYAVDRSGTAGGMQEEANAVYTFTATVSGNNLVKKAGYESDSNYKVAQSVVWSCKLTAGGKTETLDYTCTQDAESGEWTITGTLINGTSSGVFNEYLTVDTSNSKEDTIQPKLVLTLKKDMPSDFNLKVTATSKHALGYNKAYSQYCDKANAPYGYATIFPRPTKVSDAEIILEPNETGYVELGMKGGLTSEVDFTFNGISDDATTATYDAGNDRVVITLGPDEKGAGSTYTFTITATPKNSSDTATITVHVSRIDEMSIEVIDNFTTSSGTTQAVPTYDFRGRINTPDGTRASMLAATGYLVDEDLGTQRSYTLATRITCEMLDEEGESVQTYQAICIAGTDKNGTGSRTTETGTKSGDYFKVVEIKPARIEEDSDGNPYIEQVPEIDVKPLANTDTGIKNNWTLQVTMEMLHPLGTVEDTIYNKSGYYDEDGTYIYTGTPYGTAEATASVSGDTEITVPASVIIVEPGQGTNDSAQSDYEMVIPITANSGVYYMEATLDESDLTSDDTKLSDYSSDGKDNPYLASTGSSAGSRTWYLGLVIGEDEKGNNGLIDVTVTAYNTSKDVLCTLDFQLAIRRVNEVDIEEKSGESVSSWNVEGETVTLAAYPTGYGKDGVEYYAIQTVDGSTARWESKNHGEYKTPYTMEWRMEYNGDEAALSEWTEYFSSVSTSSVDEDNYRSTVTFTLKKALPSGAVIKAYSLHAYGSYANLGDSIDDDTLSTTKYNKSGKEYDEVWGELEISDSLIKITGEWKRGGTVSIAYNIPEENLVTEYNADGSIKSQYLVDDNGNWYEPNDIYTKFMFLSKYEYNGNGQPIYYQSRGLAEGYRDKSILYLSGAQSTLTDYNAKLSASVDETEYATQYSYSSPYPKIISWNYWIDISQIYMKVNVGASSDDDENSIAVGEVYYDVADVVFQYTNALPDGDDDGEWTNKKGDNTLVVYVTPDDTIDSYTSYYKLSEGWEEDYEEYTLLTDRYVGVISDVEGTENDERLWDFEVTNTTGTGADAGRSYVSFTFSNPDDYVGKVVQMVYEYNPFFCDASTNYGKDRNFDLDELDEVDGCEGILEFHFVDANITGSGTLPEVRYCPTFTENKANGATSKTLSDGSTVNYYYISDKSRFEIVETVDSAEGLARYQTTTDASTGIWTTVGNMTYSNNNWTYSAVNN